ncbi:tyrosine-type recombinase/integrase [Seohaeicola nanhaiensis]|uniref:Tyrosine-type recombinase/integrase n=1 Tax=Seohaeicola nanhaiensis TaxID=1387282 RepID=A0ABV9KP22_9RHOB
MPKKAAELNDLQVRRLARGVHAVGGVAGLLLQVTESGARSWLFRVRINGRRREIGLGGYPDTTLADARSEAREYRKLIRQGIDPLQQRRAAQRKQMTFSDAVERFAAEKAVEFRSAAHRRQWRASLDNYAVPILGKMPVSDIDLDDVLTALRPIWTTKTETATKVRQRIERVLDFATVAGSRTGRNPATWRGNLDMVLPSPSRLQGARHYPALKLGDAPSWFAAVRAREGISARALEFQALTVSRTGAVRFATWEEINLDARMWTIQPGREQSKIPPTGSAHRVPLTDRMIDLLNGLPRDNGNPLVFWAPRGGALSDAALAAVMRKIHAAQVKKDETGFVDPQTGEPAVPHGACRATFRTWVAEVTTYDGDMAEIALTHRVGTKVQQAYDRSDQVEKRREMMAHWGRYLSNE